MRPLSALPSEEVGSLRGFLFDLDDTLLTHGVLTKNAYAALWDMRDAGFRLVVVTGRPSGWGEVLARQWPIDAAITESGAVCLIREGRGFVRRDACDESERRARRMRLGQLVAELHDLVPEARLTDDVGARQSDVTWDIGEKITLPEDRIAQLTDAIIRAGARTSRSSVHLHATFDVDDKASGAIAYLVTAGEDAGAARTAYAFAGDSTNDGACFAAFHTTFGVANIRPYVPRLSVPPRYVASRTMGEGFVEIVRAILNLHTVPP